MFSSRSNSSIPSQFRWIGWTFLTVLILGLATPNADAAPQARNFKSLPIADDYYVAPISPAADDDEIKQHRRTYSKAITTKKAGEKALKDALAAGGGLTTPVVKNYLDGYVFPAMTQNDPFTLSKLGESRAKYLKTYLDERISGAARQQMIAETIRRCLPIAADSSLHPAARLNSVYLLGQLDDTLPTRGGSPPTPSATALGELVKIFVSEDANQHPIYLRIAALAGIQRNFEIKVIANRQPDASARNQVLTKVNEILAQPIDEDNAAVSYWLKRRAMQIGGLVGDLDTVDHILATINSKDQPFWLQMDAVVALKQLGTQDAGGAKNADAARAVTEFVARSLENEAAQIEAAREKLVYDNILYRDIDLIETGTNFESEAAAATGEGSGSPGGAGSGGGKFGGSGMGMGAGGPPTGSGGFGGGALLNADPAEPKLELPNYELQSIRSRIKALALKSRDAIGPSKNDGLRRYLDTKAGSVAENVVLYLDQILEDSTIGIINREDRNLTAEDENPEIPFTQQLIDLCAEKSTDLKEQVVEFTGQKPAVADPTSDN